MINCNSVMPMEQKEIESLIKISIPDAEVTITDLAGDNNHFSAHITSSLFDGKTRIQQHKMVYDALEGRMGGILHALSLKTTVKKD
jgi:stress-induced morphogen